MKLNDHPRSVAVIGAGATGTLVTANLLRRATEPLRVIIVERTGEFGQGVAYSTTSPWHRLNVPVGRMSAWVDSPDDFLDWIRNNQPTIAAEFPDLARAFVPRSVYRAYLASTLENAAKNAAPGVALEMVTDTAISVEPATACFSVRLGSGVNIVADRVVLATGYLPTTDPTVTDPSFYLNPRYVPDAWAEGALSKLNADDAVLIVGTGLTMVDLAVDLHQRGHRGTIHAISRHGLVPRSHGPSAVQPTTLPVDTSTATARGLVREFRLQVRLAASDGRDWRGVVDAQRPVTQAIWRNLPTDERRRALRHAIPYWEVHRHRIAPQVAAIVDTMVASGQLQIRAGRLTRFVVGASGVDVSYTPRGNTTMSTLNAQLVVNCTGASVDCRSNRPPLLESLVRQGFATPDPLGLGLATATNGALIGSTGQPTPGLYTVGVFRKGDLWETTAVPELRTQSAGLAGVILA